MRGKARATLLKILRIILCAVGVALPAAVPAQFLDKPFPRLVLQGDPFDDFAKHPEVWPRRVTLRYDVPVKLREKDGTVIGSAVLVRGLVLQLVKVNPGGTLDLRRGSINCTVDHVATNFIESLR